MICPKCHSKNVQFATNTKGGGYGFADGCCGSILLGPVGLLCGLCGSEVTTEEYWICADCGHKFSPEDGQKEIANEETYKNNKRKLKNLGKSAKAIRAEYSEAEERVKNAEAAYTARYLSLHTSSSAPARQAQKEATHRGRRNGVLISIVLAVVLFAIFATMFDRASAGLIAAAVLLVIALPLSLTYDDTVGDNTPSDGTSEIYKKYDEEFAGLYDVYLAEQKTLETKKAALDLLQSVEAYEKTNLPKE